MIIYTKNFEEAKKMLNVAMAAHYPKDVDIAIFIDDGLAKGITVEESNIDGLHIKRTYFTSYTSAMDVLNDIFDTVNIKDLYCIDDGGIKLQIRKVKEEKEMKNEKDYYELKLSDITVTPDDMEKFSESVTSTFKKKIAEHMGMNPLIGMDYLNGVTEAAAYGFNYGCQLVIDKIFENAKMPEKKDNHKPNKLTAENKSKLLAMLDTFVARPTPEELENEKVNLTYGELAELLEELFSVG